MVHHELETAFTMDTSSIKLGLALRERWGSRLHDLGLSAWQWSLTRAWRSCSRLPWCWNR